jgi:hypothetical protein
MKIMATFSAYKKLRQDISDRCDRAESAWKEATTASEFERLSIGTEERETSTSEVTQLIDQARIRLNSDTIEVGIFGEVKRGKSTLINALVGKRVSSMRVTPETAVPVWVENGHPRTVAIFSNGTSEEFEDSHRAQEMATQRSESGQNPRVERVIQYTELSWLPDGLRIVDTPGLQDPSLSEAYEERTLEELKRVSAAIFMFVSPPGPASHEVKMIRSLAASGIDKVFLVCNFYPDVWNNKEEREAVLEYIQKIVVDAAVASSQNAPKEIKLYAVNAKNGLIAIESGDEAAYKESGVGALRDDVEEFLNSGALKAVTAGAEERLAQARSIIESTLKKRETVLKDPSKLQNAVRDLADAVTRSENELTSLQESLRQDGEVIGSKVGQILAEPFSLSLSQVASASSISELKTAVASIDHLVAGALARASSEFENATIRSLSKAEDRLMQSFGTSDSFAGAMARTKNFDLSLGSPVTGNISTRIDWDNVAGTAAVTGLVAGGLGGALAGGAGTALLISGPIGWIIGAAAMGIIGLFGGAAAGVMGSINKISAQDRKRISDDITRMMKDAQDYGNSTGSTWGLSAAAQLKSQRDRYLGDKKKELAHIERVVKDTASRDIALREIERARLKLATV